MKGDRTKYLLDMRPDLVLLREQQKPVEKFQNTVLRPILKLQNELILAVFHQYLKKRKVQFASLSKSDQEQYIAKAIQKDQKFRNYLIGIVAGHFTLEEWGLFQDAEAELTRRIANLLIQRLQSQLSKLL